MSDAPTIEMTRYQRKPEPLDAVRFQPANWDEFGEFAAWLGVERSYYVMEPGKRESWGLTIEGVWPAAVYIRYGDWIVRGEDGVINSMSDREFSSSYEPLAEGKERSDP